jgi:glycogenin glucosyltransferase
MAAPYAFVTLLTSDNYLSGVLTLASALKDIHSAAQVAPTVNFDTICLVTPQTVDVSTIKLLRRAFDHVIGVELIGHQSEKELILLGESISNLFTSNLRSNCDVTR